MWTKLTTGLCGSLLLILTGLAHAESPLPGYTLTEVQWDMPIFPGNASSETFTVTGTVEEAIAKMDARFPGWNQTFQSQLPPLADSGNDTMATSLTEVPDYYECYIDGYGIEKNRVMGGIRYLRGLEGTTKPKNGPGSRNCGRVSCAWYAAIFWCNDNPEYKEVTWGGIADGAQKIYDSCQIFGSFDEAHRDVKGEAFMNGNWSVVVKMDSNNC